MYKQQAILVLNAGSSSLKLSLFFISTIDKKNNQNADWSALIDGKAEGAKVKIKCGKKQRELTLNAKDESAIADLIKSIWSGEDAVLSDSSDIVMVGHRVVHGGQKYFEPTAVTEEVLSDLDKLVELAPEHEGANIKAIRLAQKILPQAKQVAVFDTAYHHDMPLSSQIYALPFDWYKKLGIRRYGFHGINHKYCAMRAKELTGARRVITCHLGSGASLCASIDQKSQMTTMGYTPLEGLVMRTRSGSIDPGIIFHLLHEKRYSIEELLRVLNEESGMKGVFEKSGDMRDIESAIKNGDERAKLAFDIMIQNLAGNIAYLSTTIGGIDAIVFSGGIGEHSKLVRENVCLKLEHMGVELDQSKNSEAGNDESELSSAASKIKVLMIPAREDYEVAKECVTR